MKRLRHCFPAGRGITLLTALLLSSLAHTETMHVLLGSNDLRLEYTNGAVIRITFSANGTYVTNTGSSGTWTLEGEELCTVRDGDGASGCGELPADKSPGDSWATTDDSGDEVLASIVARS